MTHWLALVVLFGPSPAAAAPPLDDGDAPGLPSATRFVPERALHRSGRPRATPVRSARPAARVARPAARTVVVGRPPSRSGAVVVTRPCPPRPEGVSRPAPAGTTVVARPGAVAARPGGVVVARPSLVVARPVTVVRPWHGVFVYGPRPVTPVTAVDPGPVPRRALDRQGSLAVGAGVGQWLSTSPSGSDADAALSLVARYRPAEALGLQAGLGQHVGSSGGSLTDVNGQVQLFAFPWSRVSPYGFVGGTYGAGNAVSHLRAGDLDPASYAGRLGLDGGLGLELALGDHAAVDLEGKYLSWVGAAGPGTLGWSGGVVWHF